MITAILLLTSLQTTTDPVTATLITGIIGAGAAISGAILHDKRQRILKTGVKVKGIVFDIEHEYRSRDNSNLYYPVIRYVTATGEWITKKHDLGSSPSAFTEGESVTVIYDPADPSSFILNDKTSKIIPLALLISGIVLIAGAIIHYILL